MKLQKVNGGVWMKASEELPKHNEVVYIKFDVSDKLHGGLELVTELVENGWDDVEWLKPIEQGYLLTEEELSEIVNTIFDNIKSGDITKALQSITEP